MIAGAGFAGVRALRALRRYKKTLDGRSYETLRIKDPEYDNIFVTGDTASFADPKTGQAIRMAVMFSMGQGRVAAENVVRTILNKRLLKYHIWDLGSLVPMAHGSAPGAILEIPVRGEGFPVQ